MESDHRRELFVEAALRVFEQKGISRTTIGDISDEVGVARSLFYHYFPNKQAVIAAVIDNRVDDFSQQFESWCSRYDSTHPRDSLRHIVQSTRTYLTDRSSFARLITDEHNDELRQRFAAQTARRLSVVFSRIQREYGVKQAPLYRPQVSFYVLFVGFVSIATRVPSVEDDVLVNIAADVLHIDLCEQ